MKRLKEAVAILTTMGLLAMSGIALASDGDTVFNYGYDQSNQFFYWNVTSLDHEPGYETLDDALEACGLAAAEGEDPAEYGYTFDGDTITVYTLTEEGALGDPLESVEVGECGGFSGGYVTGPQGQVNKGMFMKLFNQVYEGPGRGCLVRHLARSSLGMGDLMVQSDPDFEAEDEVMTIEDGRIIFATAAAGCLKGPGNGHGDEDDDSDSERNGPPQFVLDKFGGEHPGKGKGPGNGNGRP